MYVDIVFVVLFPIQKRAFEVVCKTNQKKIFYQSNDAVAPFVVGNFVVNQIIKGEKKHTKLPT